MQGHWLGSLEPEAVRFLLGWDLVKGGFRIMSKSCLEMSNDPCRAAEGLGLKLF